MKCSAIRNLMLRKIDHELTEPEGRILDAHLKQCSNCVREYSLLNIPVTVARTLAPPEPSPFFFQTLRTRIENEVQSAVFVQQFMVLARRLIPSMAAVTIALLSIFTYLQLSNPRNDLPAAYEKAFMGENLPIPVMFTEQRNITDANILSAIANREARQDSGYELK